MNSLSYTKLKYSSAIDAKKYHCAGGPLHPNQEENQPVPIKSSADLTNRQLDPLNPTNQTKKAIKSYPTRKANRDIPESSSHPYSSKIHRHQRLFQP